MGSACCVAARDRTIISGSNRDNIPRNIRYSPSWNVRRDNMRRVSEEASINWFSDDLGTNYRLDNKSQSTIATAYASEYGSPMMMSTETRITSQPSPMMMSSSSTDSPTFNELIKTQSFDSACNYTTRDKLSCRTSIDTNTCGICSMLLTERSSCGTHRFITANEVAVVAILMCGHVYHSECLESITSEINKYDPACPVCTFGEKKVMKLESKGRVNKKFKSRVVDGDDIMFDCHKISPKMSLSSSMKSSLGKQFLKRHFSFGSKENRLVDNNFSRKKGLLWSKSNKE